MCDAMMMMEVDEDDDKRDGDVNVSFKSTNVQTFL